MAKSATQFTSQFDSAGRFISIKVKLLCVIAGILVGMTVLNVFLSSYLTNRQNKGEAYRRLSLQANVFQKDLEDMNAKFAQTVVETVNTEKTLQNLALLYSQQLAGNTNSAPFSKRVSLNALELMLHSTGINGAAVYLENYLSHYISTEEVGLLRVTAAQEQTQTTLATVTFENLTAPQGQFISTQKKVNGKFNFRLWHTWQETPLPALIPKQCDFPDHITQQILFQADSLVLQAMIPIQATLNEVLENIVLENVTIASSEPLESSAQAVPRVVGGFLFFKVIDSGFLTEQAEKTMVLPSIHSVDGNFHLQLQAFQDIAANIKIVSAALASGDVQEHFSILHTSQEIPYYHILKPWITQEGSPLILGAALSQEGTLANIRETVQWSISIALLILIIVCVIGYMLINHFIKPINTLSQIAQKLARGNFDTHAIYATRDEIGILSRAFSALIAYLREMAAIAQNISFGKMRQTISPRSKADQLGNAFHHMTAYLNDVATVATLIAEGDLTKEVALLSESDEFGQVMRSMQQGLKALIRQIRTSAHDISKTGDSIALLSDQDVRIVGNVRESINTMVTTATEMGESVEEVAQNMNILSSSVEQTSSSIAQMTTAISRNAANTANLSQQTEQAISVLEHAVQKLEGVVGQTETSKQLSQETMHDATEGQEAVEQVKSSMDTIQHTNQKVVETITRFEKLSQDIGTILDVIQNITEQTTLLALNASIIAAQAGSHGRGFAVIADEIKNLANQVSASTKDIAAIVKTVRQETGSVVHIIREGTTQIEQGADRTQQAQHMLQKILFSADRSSTMVSDIADALHHQKNIGHDLIEVMKHINGLTAEITRATQEEKSGAVQINNASQHIFTLASQTQETTVLQLNRVQKLLEIAQAVQALNEQNLASSQRISHTTVEALAGQVDMLLGSIDRFKLESK